VDEDGTISITGILGGGIINIFNAPFGTELLRIGAFDEIFILFPDGTEQETIEVEPPPDWTYEFFDDINDNLVLALLPPGVELATVLNHPDNPQPRDPSLLIPLSQREYLDRQVVAAYEEDETDIERVIITIPEIGSTLIALQFLGFMFLLVGWVLVARKREIDRMEG